MFETAFTDAAISGGTVSSPSLGISNISPRHHGSYLCTLGNAAWASLFTVSMMVTLANLVTIEHFL